MSTFQTSFFHFLRPVAAVLVIFPTTVIGFCMQPSPPIFKPKEPMVPYCINTFTNTHTCSEITLNRYLSDLESYNYDVEIYIRDLQAYVRDAVAYAECEIDTL